MLTYLIIFVDRVGPTNLRKMLSSAHPICLLNYGQDGLALRARQVDPRTLIRWTGKLVFFFFKKNLNIIKLILLDKFIKKEMFLY